MTTIEEYNELAKDMKNALVAARTQIPQDVLGMSLKLITEDYRAIASGIFIQAHMDNYKGGNGSNGKYSGPSSEKQQRFIATLAEERDDAYDIIQQYLDNNELKSAEELNSSQASTLIETLKATDKKTKR